ncbi:hypothetical protein SDC9_205576 [bioreactor metagenome]|uniref:Uncharacterized protein n=1 Tax=bioreactor metagenome TaxID=1076179 RepID=A0A645J426_9ZZZZ
MFQAHWQIGFDQFFERNAGVFLPAAHRHLFVSLHIYAYVERQHQGISAKTREPAFHHVWRLYRRGANHHTSDTRCQQGRNVVFSTYAAADLDRYVHASYQGFYQRDLSFRRIFRAG